MLKTLRGFTLLEIVVVLLIIGMISAFGIPSYRNARERNDEVLGAYDLGLMFDAMHNYEIRNDAYPTGNLPQITDINTTLNLGIIEQNMDYDCTDLSPGFDCRAVSTYGWSLHVRHDEPDVNCFAGACPRCNAASCPFD